MEDSSGLFSKHAGSYAKSDSHAAGKDLGSLVDHLPVPAGSVSIDLATGTGFTALALARSSSVVIGLDMTLEMLNEARKLAELEGASNMILMKGDAYNTPFLDASFDTATCRRAAHHFSDKPRFVSEVYRILKEPGYFGFVDMVTSESDELDVFNELERLRDHTHAAAGSMTYWLNLVKSYGFKIEYSERQEEKVTVEKWLSPVMADSVAGMKCLSFLEKNEAYFQDKYGFDGKSFIKSRCIIIGKKE
ncbi:MAG: class I SAM-dependent methyltransferase [Candidatus Thermoplasmatota archaeon]|jgi:ubiquinone/menaquinone biosynthesis C-methylase UbiE|nr:class I SAM-dependent methyltransferase [Candidatus Thermoplasmatota archaeon]